MTDDDEVLRELFSQYRSACPDVEPSFDFMPRLWEKIENTPTFSLIFQRISRVLMTASAAVCLLLAVLNMMPLARATATSSKFASYIDALAADTNVERTYYQEANRTPVDITADSR
jgi:hypothetical protein